MARIFKIDTPAKIGGLTELLAGLKVSGANVDLDSGIKLTLGTTTRQMIDLQGTGYGIGVQSNTAYVRTASRFSIHKGGSHTNSENSAGTGGTNLFTVTDSQILHVGKKVYTEDSVGSNTLTIGGNRLSLASAHSREKIRLSNNNTLNIGTEANHVTIGSGTQTANSLGLKVYSTNTDLIAQFGYGQSGTSAVNRLDSKFMGKVGINGDPVHDLDIRRVGGTLRIDVPVNTPDVDSPKILLTEDNGIYGAQLQYRAVKNQFVLSTFKQGTVQDSIIVVRDSGHVGILREPSYPLDVLGHIRFTGSLLSDSIVNLATSDNKAQGLKIGNLVVSDSFGTNAPTNGAFIKGSVGIGVNPNEKLQVAGAVKIDGKGTTINGADITKAALQIEGTLGLNGNEIYSNATDGLHIGTISTSKPIKFNPNAVTVLEIRDTEIVARQKIKAESNRAQVTFNPGQEVHTITHNFGSMNYSVALGANSVARHVAWQNKTNNTVDIILDSPYVEAITVDVILLPY